MMKAALFLITVSVIATSGEHLSTEDLDLAWNNYKLAYAKEYETVHLEVVRKANFIENYVRIVEHNELYNQGLVTYTLTINRFSDLTAAEFNQNSIYKKSESSSVGDLEIVGFVPDPRIEIPDQFDWRGKGAVTPVKDQDQAHCSSCFAFGAVAGLESHYFLKTGNLIRMSEQNLVDCNKEDGNDGCFGGDIRAAFKYVHYNDGIDSEESYPYEAVNDVCRYKASANVTSIRGYATIENGNEGHLKAAVATIGPISVPFDGSQSDFLSYDTGIYYNANCLNSPDDDIGHAVLIVGYGTENDQDYWLVKNSFGTTWGEDGYFKLARNRDNNCGITTEATYPLNY